MGIQRHIKCAFKAFANTLFDFYVPGHCCLCCASASCLLCDNCVHWLPKQDGSTCDRCDLPLVQEAPLCAGCIARPPSFDIVVTALLYKFPVDWLIHRFKYENGHVWTEVLGTLLVKRVREASAMLPDLITAVPIHWTKRFQRGFNQSEVLAHYLSRQLQIEKRNLVRKTTTTPSQQGLNRKQRLNNLANSFRCSAKLKGTHIALIDDVITTGATAETLAQVLKAAGADRVDIWALARTPK